MNHRASAEFWQEFDSLPKEVQVQARRAFQIMQGNERHPSLHLKQTRGELWSVRIGLHYRALARRDGDTLLWVWIGPHGEYDGFLGGE